MKILQLISGDLGQGGAERLVIDLAEAQANLGHNVTICCFRKPHEFALENIPKNVKLVSLNKELGKNPLFSFKLAKFIKNENFEVVHSHLNVFYYLIIALLFLCNIRYVYTVHSNPLEEEPMKWARSVRAFFIRTKKITFVGLTDMVSLRFKELYDLKQTIPTIYNGRKVQTYSVLYQRAQEDIVSYKTDKMTKVFIAVGRLMKPKNYDLMIEAFRMLQNINIELIVLGRDEDNFITKHKDVLPPNVHFLGGKSNVYDYLLCADCFIMSSLYEGLPISILEAYSAGLPVVSTPVGGIPDVVTDGVNGFLSKDLSVDSFVAAIKRYLTADECSVQRMRETNKQLFAERFDIRQTAKQYIELYESNC